ncbi:MAG: response regulator [Pseudomonadota bacterium]
MSQRILLIEDDSASMELMLYLLKSYGFTTIFAFDAHDGLTLAKSAAPDLILCDVSLPGMSGLALMRNLKQIDALRGVPIVAVTAMAMAGDEEGLMAVGFDGYIAKPIDPYGLEARLKSYLAA